MNQKALGAAKAAVQDYIRDLEPDGFGPEDADNCAQIAVQVYLKSIPNWFDGDQVEIYSKMARNKAALHKYIAGDKP